MRVDCLIGSLVGEEVGVVDRELILDWIDCRTGEEVGVVNSERVDWIDCRRESCWRCGSRVD